MILSVQQVKIRLMSDSRYFDYAAATPTDPEVVKAMEPYFTAVFGNPSSAHSFGETAALAVNNAKDVLAKFIDCSSEEIFFTSSGTESNNLAIAGIMKANKNLGRHVITTNIEHPSVLNTCRALEKDGYKVTYLAVEKNGTLRPETLRKAINKGTVLFVTHYGNSEVGSLHDVPALSKICQEKHVIFHLDACQATSFLKLDVKALGADLLTFNGSKMYGPKGIAALYIKNGLNIYPIIYGGGQQKSLRSGTENVPGIVGLAASAEIIEKHRSKDAVRIEKLRNYLECEIIKIAGVRVNLFREKRLPNHLSVTFLNVKNSNLVELFNRVGFALSAGSACSAKSLAESHVLTGIGLTPIEIHSTVRITLGRQTTKRDCQALLAAIRTTT